ncbi:putative exosome complex exonuclease RRP40 [Trypanosoma vivax]|nr:putative exosome complex exonuclease RRP40 [Trypanosoma vivax]
MVRNLEGVHEIGPHGSHVYLPGDAVLALETGAVVSLGGGLYPLPQLNNQPEQRDGHSASVDLNAVVVAEFCGPVSCSTNSNRARHYALDGPATRRYTYATGEPIVAIVTKKNANYYTCYTGASSTAVLDALAFDGATKTSRPRLQEGDVVYAFVKACGCADPSNPSDLGVHAIPSTADEVELSCMAGEVGLQTRDWTSTEAIFGPLLGGTVIRVTLPYARSLISGPASQLLAYIGERVPYDVCVGVNGLVWVRGQPCKADPTAEVRRTVAVASCIVESQEDETQEAMMQRVHSYFPVE